MQTRASLSDQGPAQPRAAREQRTPFTGRTTSVLTNGPITCELTCCKRRSFLKHLLRPQIFSILLFLWYADDVRVTSITTEPVHTWSRVMANNAGLDTALDEMAQNTAKQEHSVFFAGQCARQCMAALNGKAVLPGSTGPVARYLCPHLDIMGSIRPELERRARRPSEPGPDSAQCGFVQASHCVFGAFFPGAGGFNSEDVSGIPSLAIPGLRRFGPFYPGSRTKDDERKSDTQYETGRWHRKKKAHSRQKEGVGLPWPGATCHGTSRSPPSMVPEPL